MKTIADLKAEYDRTQPARRRNWVQLKLLSADAANVRLMISKGEIAEHDAPTNKRMNPVQTK